MKTFLQRHRLFTLVLVLGIATPVTAQQARRRDAPRLPKTVTFKQDVEYVTAGHERQKLDLYLPKQPAGEKLPVVVFIHGGGWKNGDKAGGRRFVVPLVAQRKFVGASINYRLSQHALWPAQIHDCKAAIRWLRGNAKEYGIDPERIGVIGTSAGGHLVAMLGTTGEVKELEGDLGNHNDQSSRVAAVVDFFGPTNFLTMNDFPGRLNHDSADSPESKLIGGPIQEMKKKVKTASPLTYVSPEDAAFLIVHGSDDPLVPIDQSIQLDQALDKAKVSSTLIQIKDGQHGRFRNLKVNEIVSDFWSQQLLNQKIHIPEVVLEEPTE